MADGRCGFQTAVRECGLPSRHDGPHSTRADTSARPEFPPKVISRWVQGGCVNTERLVAELREYADYFGGNG